MDIQAIKAYNQDEDFNEESLVNDFESVVGFDIVAEAKEFANIQKKVQDVITSVEEKTQVLGHVAEKLEAIEKEKDNFDEWAKDVKKKFESGEIMDDTIKVCITKWRKSMSFFKNNTLFRIVNADADAI